MGDPRHAISLWLDEQLSQQQLLPGIPDEVTLDLIVPKLPWRTLIILPVVSRKWHLALQSRKVYDARKRAHATENLFVLNMLGPAKFFRDSRDSVGLPLSSRDGTSRVLPGIRVPSNELKSLCTADIAPDDRLSAEELEFSWTTNIASYDGKIYVLAGQYVSKYYQAPSSRVLVFDLAGHGQWTECASLLGSRPSGRAWAGKGFEKDGKIYVREEYYFGSVNMEAEVYDPELNVWSFITPPMDGEWVKSEAFGRFAVTV